MSISLQGLRKRYPDGTEAVRGVDLSVADGEFVTLLGPSGCGKTTTLRLIAGLEDPTAGTIRISGREVTKLDPGDRDVAMVFQNYALYPHMTVAENMTLNLTVRGMSKVDALARARDTARLLGIDDLLNRKPSTLSGGQRQRVALGRAIIRSPVAFLMDEPLSNLDLKLREHMRTELKALHARLKVTTVYVTHDQSEALILSDRVVVMNRGKIEQAGEPLDIYERPSNRFVAEFVGSPSINILEAIVENESIKIGDQLIAWGLSISGLPEKIHVGIRPEDIVMSDPRPDLLSGRIAFTEPYGSVTYAFVEVKAQRAGVNRPYIVASMSVQAPMMAGQDVGLRIRGERLTIFDTHTGIALLHTGAQRRAAQPSLAVKPQQVVLG